MTQPYSLILLVQQSKMLLLQQKTGACIRDNKKISTFLTINNNMVIISSLYLSETVETIDLEQANLTLEL